MGDAFVDIVEELEKETRREHETLNRNFTKVGLCELVLMD